MFYSEDGDTLEQVAQKGGQYPIAGNIPGQAGQGSKEPDAVEDVPVHCRGI